MKKLKITIFWGTLLLLSLSQTGCDNKEKIESSDQEKVRVTLARVEMREIIREIKASAILEAHRSVTISFLQGGYLETADFDMGDQVEAGDILAVLDRRALEAESMRAEAALEKAQRDYRRAQELFRAEVISSDQFKDAETGLKLTEGAENAASFALEHGCLTAPFSGKIVDRYAEPGQIVPPGAPVYRLVDDKTLEMTLGIAERDIGAILIGDRATITVPSVPQTSAEGRVTGLPSAGEFTKGVLPMKVEFVNPGDWLPGMAARAVITAGTPEKALALPAEAVRVSSEGEAYCYRYRRESGDVVKTPIIVGNPLNGTLVVHSGIAEGELVVCGGVVRVRDGDNVIVEETDAPAEFSSSNNKLGQDKTADKHAGDE